MKQFKSASVGRKKPPEGSKKPPTRRKKPPAASIPVDTGPTAGATGHAVTATTTPSEEIAKLQAMITELQQQQQMNTAVVVVGNTTNSSDVDADSDDDRKMPALDLTRVHATPHRPPNDYAFAGPASNINQATTTAVPAFDRDLQPNVAVAAASSNSIAPIVLHTASPTVYVYTVMYSWLIVCNH
jgi:hypothetical protein